MNRSNIVFGVLLIMLLGLGVSLATRSRAHPAAPTSSVAKRPELPPKPKTSEPPPKASSAPTASARKHPSTPKKPRVLLERELTTIASDWALLAPGVLQNDGLEPNKKAPFGKAGLGVRLKASEQRSDIENALARGGADAAGADVAILPLPEFVASYEALKALDPVMFLITGWSSGRDALLSRFDRLEKLPASGPLAVRGMPGTSAMFLAAFVLDATGVGLERVEFEPSDAENPQAALWALPRQQLGGVPKEYDGTVLLSTGEALQLIPYVAVAQRSFVEQHTEALVAFSRVWFDGQARVTRDPTAASRRLAQLAGSPEPLALLAQLGEIRTSSVTDNALSAGVAGRGAVNLTSLFDRAWRYWRALKVLTTPSPERAPVSGEVITQLVLGNAQPGPTRPSAPRLPDARETQDAPLLSLNAGPAPRADAEIVGDVGFAAGVFSRSRLRLSVYSQSIYDKKRTETLVAQVSERFDLSEGRLVARQAPQTSPGSYRLEIMPVE
jgi:ABC-type nitrate/sulfonate/bicarbonate transport system substrate-binding protein